MHQCMICFEEKIQDDILTCGNKECFMKICKICLKGVINIYPGHILQKDFDKCQNCKKRPINDDYYESNRQLQLLIDEYDESIINNEIQQNTQLMWCCECEKLQKNTTPENELNSQNICNVCKKKWLYRNLNSQSSEEYDYQDQLQIQSVLCKSGHFEKV